MRLIDADAFKNYIRSGYEEMKHLFNENLKVATLVTESFCKDIDEQPTIQPEPHWIPCSERLPEVGREILFCDDFGDIFVGHRAIEHWWSVDDKVKNVTAWMPLPEPFKGVTK